MRIFQTALLSLGILGIGGNLVQAQPSPTTRSSQDEQAAAQWLLVADLPDKISLPGRLCAIPRGNSVFMTTKGARIPLLDAGALTNLPPGLPVKLDATKNRDQMGFKVDRLTPALLGTWQQGTKEKFPTAQFPKLNSAYVTLESETGNLAKIKLETKDLVRLESSFKGIEVAAVAEYAAAREGGVELAKDLCRQYESARISRKAIYARLDSYRPGVYRTIYENSQNAVAIVRKSGDVRSVFGSGVLIGDNLVLTCGHCVPTDFLAEWEIWFDFATESEIPKDVYEITEIVMRGKSPAKDLPDLDFCLIRIKPKPGAGKIQTTRPTLSSHPLHRDDAIYVVGYPLGNQRTVHDNAFVLFPFSADERELTELKMFVCAESQRSADRGSMLDGFLKSYLPSLHRKGNFDNFSTKWHTPTILADCDTFHGDSGAAAYDRRTGYIVGILVAGEPDNVSHPDAGWRHHEAIIPIGEIIRQVDANVGVKGWREKYNVQIKE